MQSSEQQEQTREQKQQEIIKLMQERITIVWNEMHAASDQDRSEITYLQQMEALSNEMESISLILLEQIDDELNPQAVDATSNRSIVNARFDDAISFAARIRQTFVNTPEVNTEFLDICNKRRSGEYSVIEVKTRITQLFQGYPELLLAFNRFLPPEHQITVEVADNAEAAPSGTNPGEDN